MAETRRAPGIFAVVCLLATVALVVASVPAAAFYQDANVVITLDKSAYRVGDFVNVTIHVFSLAVPSDADSISLRLNPSSASTRVVNVTHDALGIYNATFRIGTTDANLSDPYVSGTIMAQVSAVVSGLSDTEFDLVTVLPQTNLVFAMTPATFDAAPGSTVAIGLQLTANGAPRDADHLAVNAYLLEGSLGGGGLSVSLSNVSRGNYSATFVVPTYIETPALVYVTATANVSAARLYRFLPISVTGPQPFEIWAYTSQFLPPVAAFTLFVGDRAGGFVEGASVTLNYSYIASSSGSSFVTKYATGTTDAYGRAGFSLDLGGATNVFVVTYAGNVTLGASRQAFSGDVYAPTTPGTFFQIARTNPYAYFAANATAVLNYTVTTTGSPVAGQEVYYYAQSDTEFVGAGNVSSDGNGDFSLSLHMPASTLRVLLISKWGGTWSSTTDYVLPFSPLNVTTTPVRIGTVVRVTVTFPEPGRWYVGASLGPYQPILAASPWLEVSGFFASSSPVQAGAQASYNFSLPRFLPKDADYLLSAVALPASSLTNGSFAGEYGFAELFHITNVPAQVRENLSTTTPAVGDVVTASASGSYDSDGYIVAYRIAWGDGNVSDWTGSPTFSHTFGAPGDYRVSMSAMDDSGAVSVTQTVIHVEATILGLRVSWAVPLFLAIAAVAVAVIVVVWWRRRTRPAPTPPPAQPAAPEAPAAPGTPPGKP